MRLDIRRAREIFARLLCLSLVSLAISSCIISYYGLRDGLERGRNCHYIDSKIEEYPSFNSSTKAITSTRQAAGCETVHLTLICGGHDATRDFYTLLKSILFYRSNIKLHLHLFVNNVSETIIKEIFRTLIVPDLNVTYYQMSKYEPEIAWIPNQHYSHRYGLLKLVVPSVLAEARVERVIFLDTDMLAHGDIAHLWSEFLRFDSTATNESFLGLVENQSDWYLEDAELDMPSYQARKVSWPALGRGFNTGMMLIDLSRLKKISWHSMWSDVTETELISHLTTALADQDIYNAVIKKNSRIVLKLNCRYNIQLNDHTLLNVTCPNHQVGRGFSLTHWNSPYKLGTKNPWAEYYKSWYTTFFNWNAKLLERSSGCLVTNQDDFKTPATTSPPKGRLEEYCQDIRPRPHERLRTFLYFLEFELEHWQEVDVTIVVHLSMDRFRALDELASHWPGPMSVALYLNEMDLSLFTELLQTTECLSKRKNVGYHLVFRDAGSNYPINRLRNIALNNVITPYVFMTDVDFLPGPSLYDYLKTVIKKMTDENGQDEPLRKRALIVPAFETNEYKFEYPSSKAELIKQLDLGTLSKFRESIWPRGQAATDYERWKTATKPYAINWKPEYEPFIVTSADVIRYDERFNGFGWNKVEHIMKLAALDYEFYVLPEAFSIHQFHPASYDISRHRESKKYQACIRLLKQTFLLELNQSYPKFMGNLTRRAVDSR